MNTNRQNQWNTVLNAVKNSPVKTFEFEGNTYHFKCDYMLPYGECHYARIFSQLIYQKECLGIITPGDLLIETTSGSGGRAAAAVATALGYKIKIAVPAGGEKARENAITKAGGELELTPAEAYINGVADFVKRFLARHRDAKYLNHVAGDITGRGIETVNETAIDAFRPFSREVADANIVPDILVAPLGNGTTTLSMGSELKSLFPSIIVVGFEAASSALVYRKKFPGKYQRVFGIEDPSVIARHDLPGTTYANPKWTVPALEACLPYVDKVGLVTSNHVDAAFMEAVGFKPTDKSEWIVKWDDFHHEAINEFGRTGKAGFAVAVTIARKKGLSNKHFLIPVFDAAWHYDK